MTRSATPAQTYAVIVGIEQYIVGSRWNLDGPARDALVFTRWLRDRGVPAKNIFAYVSPLDVNAGVVDEFRAEGVDPAPALSDDIRRCFSETLPTLTGDLLLVYWGGHGVVTDGSAHRLFFANASQKDKRNLEFETLVEAGHSRSYQSLPNQVILVDACANYFEDMRIAISIPGERLPKDTTLARDVVQLVMFAAAAGEAAINDNLKRSGAFSTTLMDLLNEPQAFPPDFGRINERVKAHFAQLRKDGQSRQTPVHYLWDGSDIGDGREESGTIPGAGDMLRAARRWNLSITQVRALAVEVARCPSMQARQTRDAVVDALPADVRKAISLRYDEPVPDLQSIVSASLKSQPDLSRFFDALSAHEADTFASQSAREKSERLLKVASAAWALRHVQITESQRVAFYYQSAPDCQDAPAAFDLDSLMESLDEKPPRGGCSRLLEFMERIHSATHDATLDKWLSAQVPAQRAEFRALFDAEEALANRPAPYLSVMVRTSRLKAGETPEVEAWLWTGDASRDKHYLEKCETAIDSVRAVFLTMLTDAEGIAGSNLRIEFLVPREQLCIGPEHWEIPATDFSPPSRLGCDHPVVMRWRERVREPGPAQRGAWESRMRTIETRLQSGLMASFLWVSTETHDYRKVRDEMTRADSGECVGMLFVPPDVPADLRVDLLTATLLGGAPVVCWLGQAPRDWAQVKQRMSGMAAAGAVDALPDRIWQIRRTGGSELADHVSVIWDRPDHLPQPFMARVPGQRGAS